MPKTKVALFDLTGCEGCEFHLLSLNELLLDFFQDFEITHWRLLSQDQKKDFDIAFIEGAATTGDHVKLLKQIRETSQIVVAVGACAISGNIFAQLTEEQREKLAPQIYNRNYRLKAKFLKPVDQFIKVDFIVPGCPPDLEKFKELLHQFKNQPSASQALDVPPPDYVAKIEGHGQLKINFKEKKVKFEVEESERLIEGLLLGKSYQKAPFINARICGICPIAHNLCSWKAIEDALKITPHPTAISLRKILLAAQIIKSHLLHLFFLTLPDYAHLQSSVELSVKYPSQFHLMLNIKKASEKILQIIAGSTAFPLNTTLGGFANPISKDTLLAAIEQVHQALDESWDLIKLFANFQNYPLKTNTQFLCLETDGNYPFYQGKINQQIKEIVENNSPAKSGVLENGQVVKVGALARINKHADGLNSQAKKALSDNPINVENPFNNNLAQAVEILHFLEEIINLGEALRPQNLENAPGLNKPSFAGDKQRGQAVLEAPRGVLTHQVELNNQGKITNYNIIPPTQINLASLEKEAQELVSQSKQNPEELTHEVENLIRAFDPCITCAVH